MNQPTSRNDEQDATIQSSQQEIEIHTTSKVSENVNPSAIIEEDVFNDQTIQLLKDKIKTLEENQNTNVKDPENASEVTDSEKPNLNIPSDSVIKLLEGFVSSKASTSNKFANFYDPSKKDENLYIAKLVFSIAFGIFIVSYLFSYLSAKSIEEQYESRKEKLADMIDINTGAYREKYVFSLNQFKEYLHRKNQILKDTKSDHTLIFIDSIADTSLLQNNTKKLISKNLFFTKNEDKGDNKYYYIENFGLNNLHDLKLNQEKNLASKLKIFDDKQEVSFLDFAKYLEEVDESKLKRIRARLDSDNKFNLSNYVETESAQLEKEKKQLETRIKFLEQSLEIKSKKTDHKFVDSLLFASKVIEFMKNNNNILIKDNINITCNSKNTSDIEFHKSDVFKSNDSVVSKVLASLNTFFKSNKNQKYDARINFLVLLNSFSNNIQSPIEMIGDNEGLKNINFKEIIEFNPDIAKENTYKESVLFVLHEAYQNLKILANNDVSQKTAVVKEISDLTIQLNSLSTTNVSIGKYKQNKTYLFQKQFDLCSDAIGYTINKAVKYMALYNALIWVIIIFSIAIGGCIFVISSAGWNDVNNSLRVFTICVVAVLAVSNLVLLTIKPQSNFKNYLAKADMNEENQRKIITFFNNYESLKHSQVDSMLKENMKSMTKFTDIVPDVDESGLMKDMSKFTNM